MKLTKKAAALLLAASLAVSVCATPVFADGPVMGSEEGSNTNKSANTLVTYNVDCSYTWSIPKKIDFGANAGLGQTRIVEATADKDAENVPASGNGHDGRGNAPKVCVTKNIIDDNRALNISIDTDGPSGTTYEHRAMKFYVQTTTNAATKYYFTITKNSGGTWNAASDPVLTVPSGTNTGEQGLVFTLDTTALNHAEVEKAGTYNGKVVFKSELKPF